MDPVDQIIAHRQQLVLQVKNLLIDTLQLEMAADEIAEDSVLFGFGLGLDSIDALSLIVAIEDTFQVSVPEDGLTLLRSVNTVTDFVAANQVSELENDERIA